MIRDVLEKDIPRLKELHAADGFDWDFPEWPMLVAKVWVDENDRPLMMVGSKLIAEAVLISSKEGTPGMRLAMLQQLFADVYRDTAKQGIRWGVTWIPDCIWKAYSRRLKVFGWKTCKYRTMVLEVRE